MSFISTFARLRTCGVALALMVALSLAAASDAGAASFTAKSTAELETDIETANTNGAENTIHLEANTAYIPAKTLTLSNTSHPQIIEGPEGHSAIHGPEVEGAAVEPETSELVVLKAGVTATFKWIDWTLAGGLGNPGFFLAESATLNLEEDGVQNMNGNAIDVHGGATLNAVNSTIAKTTTGDGIVDDGTVNLTNSTVAFNEEGGIENAGTLSLTNSIVAENTSAGQHDCSNHPANTSDHSLDSDGTCGVGALSSMNPKLKTALNFDGGRTRLASLTPGSPAIDAGDEAKCPTIDQRGYKRPDVAGTPCDIGADEYNSVKPVITSATVPAGITVQGGASGAIVKFTPPSATTTGEAEVESVTCSPETDHIFPVGATTVSCVAKDGHENESTPVTFEVDVYAMSLLFGRQGESPGEFEGPMGVAVGPNGNVWVTDTGRSSVDEFSEAGQYLGHIGAFGTEHDPCTATMCFPFAVAIDSHGNVWVADTDDSRIKEFSESGGLIRQVGSFGSGEGEMVDPEGVAIDSHGNVWVADAGNARVDEFSETGQFLREFGSKGKGSGQFEWPSGIAVDSHGNVWVSDWPTDRVQEFTSEGTFERQVLTLDAPHGVAVNSENDLFVADYVSGVVQEFNENGVTLGQFGPGPLDSPWGIAVDSHGNVWLSNAGWVTNASGRRVTESQGVEEWDPASTSGEGAGAASVPSSVSSEAGGAPHSGGSLALTGTDSGTPLDALGPDAVVPPSVAAGILVPAAASSLSGPPSVSRPATASAARSRKTTSHNDSLLTRVASRGRLCARASRRFGRSSAARLGACAANARRRGRTTGR
jgi:sugar lactone lactonase YvrE